MSNDGGGRYVLPLIVLPFMILATLNAGGYRYGASDQAFYIPAALLKLDPSLYPRDRSMILSQAKLTTSDDVIAAIAGVSGASLPKVFVAAYAVSVVVVALGAWLVARSLYATTWGAVALLAAMTMRHAIARSGTNTLEGYFHPRQMVFGLGLIAAGAFLRGRFMVAAGVVAVSAAIHPTAALWFGVWLLAAWLVERPAEGPRERTGAAGVYRSRWILFLAAALPLTAIAAWALTAGPLAGRLAPMDAEWLRMLVEKSYLFPLQWPPYAWLFNLGYIPVIAIVYMKRRRAGLVGDRERALVLGSVVLIAAFVVFLILHSLRIILAIQLQPARLFLVFDFLATVYVVWALAEGPRPQLRRAQLVALLIAVLSAARGTYVILEVRRPLMQVTIRDDDWGRVMAWARTTDRGSGFLADPIHAALYGTTVRIAGERDVFVEGLKDVAMGIYDRDVAHRSDERLRRLNDFAVLSAEEARRIAITYDLDYLVAEGTFALPVAFESGKLRVYRLR